VPEGKSGKADDVESKTARRGVEKAAGKRKEKKMGLRTVSQQATGSFSPDGCSPTGKMVAAGYIMSPIDLSAG
jgi:hypothetical protein